MSTSSYCLFMAQLQPHSPPKLPPSLLNVSRTGTNEDFFVIRPVRFSRNDANMAQGGTSTSVRDMHHSLNATNINGTVDIHYYHTQARSQTPPLPTHNIPFDQNTHFINREDIFSKLSIKCNGRAARVALVGLGGVG